MTAYDPARHCGETTRAGTPCTLPKGWGTDHVGAGHCKRHRGNTPSHRKQAHRMLAESRAAASLAEMGVTPIGNPLVAFADLAAEAVALKDHFAGLVAQLRNDLRYEDAKGGEQLRAEVALYERAMDRAAKLLAEWVRLGLEERMVAITQAQAERVITAIDAILDRLELTDAQRSRAVIEVPSVLRELVPG